MAKKYNNNGKFGNIEYRMSKAMASSFLKTRRKDEMKMDENEFLCKVVNENFGLIGNCVKVIIS